MTIGLILNNSLSALRINQRSISVLSNNIANVNTDGYSRQTVSQSAMVVEGVGSGVRFEDIQRAVDKYLQGAVYENGALMNHAEVMNDYASRVQIFLGEPGSDNSMDAYVTEFFRAMQALAETPERSSYRSNAINAANTLANEMNALAENLHDLQRQAESDMRDAVNQMNVLMRKLESTNIAIARASALNQPTAGLHDERDKALRALSEYVDVDIFYDAQGRVNIYTGNGIPLVDGNRQEVRFDPRTALQSFIDGDASKALQIVTLDATGAVIGSPRDLITAGAPGETSTDLVAGKLRGLFEVRDVMIPEILSQFDMFASRLRDEVNRVHNKGVSFPPPTMLTGTRAVRALDASDWSGTVRIAALDPQGNPVRPGYADEQFTGVRPLLLDLSALDAGYGRGRPTVQSIINEINEHFSAPRLKTKLGGMNSINLVSANDRLPNGVPSVFTFDLELENISNRTASLFVNGVTVYDDAGNDISNVTDTIRNFTLDPTMTYQTASGFREVAVRVQGNDLPKVGERIFLPDPGNLPTNIGGISSQFYTGYFTVKNVIGNDVIIDIAETPTLSEAVNHTGSELIPAYQSVAGGQKMRTTGNGQFIADLSGNNASGYYDIVVNMLVENSDGTTAFSAVTYRVQNNREDMINDRYTSVFANGDAIRELPASSQEVMRAILVDAEGRELPKINGDYIDAPGYLRLVGNNPNVTIAIDSMDSRQLGNSTVNPPAPGTARGFSHYFEMNNFFTSNAPSQTGDAVAASAVNMAVEQRILDNPNLLASGQLSASRQPADAAAPRQYTYVRYSGDNGLMQELASVATRSIAFDAAGGLPQGQMSLNDYMAELLGYVSSQAVAADANYTNAETLFEGFSSRLNAMTGVNLDEELANTILYQNAYNASAKLVKLADELYEELLGLI